MNNFLIIEQDKAVYMINLEEVKGLSIIGTEITVVYKTADTAGKDKDSFIVTPVVAHNLKHNFIKYGVK